MTIGTKHRIGFKQTAVEMIDGSFAQQNIETPAGILVSGAADVASTATIIVADNPGRSILLLVNAGSAIVYLGGDTVGAATGFPLAANGSIELRTTSDVWGVAASGTVNVRYLEITN